MLASKEQNPGQKVTRVRSHEEIQKILRAEINALCQKLEEIEKLTVASFDHCVERITRRHRVEISLLHALYANSHHGPVTGVLSYAKQIEVLGRSALFDSAWYLQAYADVAESGIEPREHYVRSGAFEGRNPSVNFDTMAYYEANPDVAAAGWPALVHYASFGAAEGRKMS